MPKSKTILTDKQEVFCQEYIKDYNATQAAIRAGYSPKTANEMASELKEKPHVLKRIEELKQKVADKNELTADRIIKELMKIAFADKRAIASWNESGIRFKPSDELSDFDAASISEISEVVNESGGMLKVKQHDKVKALELLAKIQGMLKDKVEVSGKLTLEDLVLQSMKDEE